MVCDKQDGSATSSEYPCVCGTAVCATDELCTSSESVCEIGPGYVETALRSGVCPVGYQHISSYSACRDAAGKLDGKQWSGLRNALEWQLGCSGNTDGQIRFNTADFWSREHGQHDVYNLCIRSSVVCDNQDGSGTSSEYPCVCGTAVCATNELCTSSESVCEIGPGYVETALKSNVCPVGYQHISSESECREAAEQLSGKQWMGLFDHSGWQRGCSGDTNGNIRFNTASVWLGGHDTYNLCMSPTSSPTSSPPPDEQPYL
jgi:hypothetical protein